MSWLRREERGRLSFSDAGVLPGNGDWSDGVANNTSSGTGGLSIC